MEQRMRAEAFHALHQRGRPLVLGNAWDAASARILELAGYAAIGTTSAGLAWSLGYPDGQRVPVELLVRTVERIVATVRLPVSVDIERGYGATAAEVVEVVGALVDVGAVGLNIEDGMGDPAALAEKVTALRGLAARRGVPLFINARTDAYLRPAGEGEARFADAVRRLEAYAAAGADGAFAPGLADLGEIARLVRAVAKPINIYAAPGVPPVGDLARVGVARVSVGCGPMQATLALTRRIADELLGAGTYDAFTDQGLAYGDANRMFLG